MINAEIGFRNPSNIKTVFNGINPVNNFVNAP